MCDYWLEKINNSKRKYIFNHFNFRIPSRDRLRLRRESIICNYLDINEKRVLLTFESARSVFERSTCHHRPKNKQ
ncbi:Hypothetical predicted protein [Podarcis lilfordi]|uniref:Uncharacterized protein n=1 Tax=Podarcis lilfordi TaxID=74358 RepID=A0AA35P262_9SAUR|nr:Hypothetical predicted protein [Podarcis lilfordi]